LQLSVVLCNTLRLSNSQGEWLGEARFCCVSSLPLSSWYSWYSLQKLRLYKLNLSKLCPKYCRSLFRGHGVCARQMLLKCWKELSKNVWHGLVANQDNVELGNWSNFASHFKIVQGHSKLYRWVGCVWVLPIIANMLHFCDDFFKYSKVWR